MSQLIKCISIKRAYLARLYSLCANFAEDDISVSILNKNIIFGGMNPKSSFEFLIKEPPLKSLFDFETPSKETNNIHFTVSQDNFSKILAPFSKMGRSVRPKKDTDMVSIEINDSDKIRFIQDNLNHESIEISVRVGEGTWPPLPDDDWEFSISPDMLSDCILRMASSGGPKIELKQDGDSLWIESEAGSEKVPIQASKPLSSQINVSRMTLMKVKAQLNDYEIIKVGIRNYFLMIEGQWKHGICKWKLDAIS